MASFKSDFFVSFAIINVDQGVRDEGGAHVDFKMEGSVACVVKYVRVPCTKIKGSESFRATEGNVSCAAKETSVSSARIESIMASTNK